MSANVPEVQVIDDRDTSAIIKVVGYFTGATVANTKIQSNSLFGANTSMPCLMSITAVQYSTSVAGGYVAVQYVGSSNVHAVTAGHYNDGEFTRYIPNNAAAPTGDLNVFTSGAAAGDSFTLLISVAKERQGIAGIGANAWANTSTWY